jgi:preprotein translocase subunit SecA
MGPIYHLLGLSVSGLSTAASRSWPFLLRPDYTDEKDTATSTCGPMSRREAYLADITYGTNNEFGFDYLRDNMVLDLSQCVQRELNYAIVDEVDNILIDEARTPLIISGPAEESGPHLPPHGPHRARLRREVDYTIDEKARVVTLTEEGIAKVERWLGMDNLYSTGALRADPYLDNALRAHVPLQTRPRLHRQGRPGDHRGRVHRPPDVRPALLGGAAPGHRGQRGVIQRESLTLATITFQNYFRMYRRSWPA